MPQQATLTTVRPDGRLHVTPVRFSWDDNRSIAYVLTVAGRVKARNLAGPAVGRAALCQSAGMRWITLAGQAVVHDDMTVVAEAQRRYFERYRVMPPAPPGRLVIEIHVEQVTSLLG